MLINVVRCWLAAVGLVLLAVPAAAQPSLADNVRLIVDVSGVEVSVDSNRALMQSVLDELAIQANLNVVQHVPLVGELTLKFERFSLADALDEILGETSYQLYDTINAPRDRDILWIFAEGTSVDLAATVFLETDVLKGDLQTRKRAVKALQKIGTPEAVAALIMALSDEDADVQVMAIRALARIGGDDALSAIASSAMDSNPRVRSEAAQALSTVDGESAGEYLSLAMQDGNAMVRVSVVDSVSDLPPEQAMTVLNTALRDPDPTVRMEAVDVLEEMGGEAAIAALRSAGGDQDPDVQDALMESLMLLEDAGVRPRGLTP